MMLPIIKEAVNELVDFIKPTFGPSKNTVLIFGEVLDDGVKIAQLFKFDDEKKNEILRIIRQVSFKTNERVKDGTTSSLILLQGIVNSDMEIDELVKSSRESISSLKGKLRNVSSEKDLQDIAMVSCNDKKLADMIGELVYKVGEDGYIMINNSNNLETTYKITKGFQFQSGHGYSSSVELDDCRVVTFNKKVRGQDVIPLLKDKSNLLIIADDFHEEINDLIRSNDVKVLLVNSPGMGLQRKNALDDINCICTSKVKVIATQHTTTIIGGEIPLDRIEEIKKLNPDSDFEKELLKERIAMLSGKLAIIDVGGKTPEEVSIIKDKIEDSINSTRWAYKSGAIRGAGLELSEVNTSSEKFNEALKLPRKVLSENGIVSEVLDPIEVIVAAIESAVSISSILLSIKKIK